MPRTAIIGGGISGLAAALRVADLRHQVVLFESEGQLGGLGGWFTWRGVDLERFYHCILPGDQALLALIRELGLEGSLVWRRVRMGFMYRRRLYSLDGPLDLLRFTPLSVVERVRMGLLGIRARRHGMDPALDGITVSDWLRPQVGERAFRVVWRPLLEAKIGNASHVIPALWLSSRMSREKNTGPEVKGCLRGGYRSLVDALERRLHEREVEIRFHTRVRAIEDDRDRRLLLRFQDGTCEPFETVISTLPLPHLQQATAGLQLDGRLSNLALDYQGVVTGVFLLGQPPSPYYWMPIVDSGTTAQGVIEMSNLVPPERSRGLYVVYLVNYTHRNSPLYRASDDEMLARYSADLAALFPRAAGTVVDRYVFRAPFVEPLWSLHFGRRRPPTTVLPGRLYMSCTAQVYPRVNSWNSCCEVVEEMMAGFTADMRERTSAQGAPPRPGAPAGEVKASGL
jgi:protoporphyrinogen oxidase